MAKRIIDWYEVSQRVHEAMFDKDLSYKEVSKASGVSVSVIRRFINDGDGIRLDALLGVLDCLNLTPDYVFGYLDKKLQ